MTRPKDPSQRAGHNTHLTLIQGGLAKAPRMPTGLDDEGKKVWRKVWSLGNPYTEADVWAITRYCELHDRRKALLDALQSDGLMTTGSKNQPVLHPALRAITDVEGRLASLETTLLLTPEARARFGLGNHEEDELEGFLDDDWQQR